MKITVLVPAIFLKYTGSGVLKVEGSTAGEVINNLANTYTPLRKHLYSEEGRLRSFINIYLNGEDIKLLDDEDTVVKDEDVLNIIPAVTGVVI